MNISINAAITNNINTIIVLIIASLINLSESFIASFILFLVSIALITLIYVINNIKPPAIANIPDGISNIP